jgi:hypothetical protein
MVGRNIPARSYLPNWMIYRMAQMRRSAAMGCKTQADTRTYPFASQFIFFQGKRLNG